MAATSMAAAIAASLPAPQAAPTQVAPTYEAIPASMSKVIDLESDIPLQCVQLDGLVSTEIALHFTPHPHGTDHASSMIFQSLALTI